MQFDLRSKPFDLKYTLAQMRVQIHGRITIERSTPTGVLRSMVTLSSLLETVLCLLRTQKQKQVQIPDIQIGVYRGVKPSPAGKGDIRHRRTSGLSLLRCAFSVDEEVALLWAFRL